MIQRLSQLFIASLAVLFLLTAQPIDAAGPAGLFSLQPNSARATALGGANVTLVDAESALHNPGAMGLYGLSHRFSASLPNATTWLPKLSSELELSSYSGQYTIWGKPKANTNGYLSNKSLAITLGVSHLNFDQGILERRFSSGSLIGTDTLNENVTKVSLGIGVNRAIRFGVGISSSHFRFTAPKNNITIPIESNKASASSAELGIIIEAPLTKHFSEIWQLSFTPSLAFTHSLSSPSVKFNDSTQSSKLPNSSKLGGSLYFDLRKNSFALLSSLFLLETNRAKSQPKPAGLDVSRYGVEIGVGETIFIRYGGFYDRLSAQSFSTVNTSGVGFSLGGLMRLIQHLDKSYNNQNNLPRGLDLRIDYGKYSDNTTHGLAGTEFFKITASL